jgi:hypothetical protein
MRPVLLALAALSFASLPLVAQQTAAVAAGATWSAGTVLRRRGPA